MIKIESNDVKYANLTPYTPMAGNRCLFLSSSPTYAVSLADENKLILRELIIDTFEEHKWEHTFKRISWN